MERFIYSKLPSSGNLFIAGCVLGWDRLFYMYSDLWIMKIPIIIITNFFTSQSFLYREVSLAVYSGVITWAQMPIPPFFCAFLMYGVLPYSIMVLYELFLLCNLSWQDYCEIFMLTPIPQWLIQLFQLSFHTNIGWEHTCPYIHYLIWVIASSEFYYQVKQSH
jgi:hypothetical protein